VVTVELSPEERKRIYEEEKARIESQEQIEREKGKTPVLTTTGLSPNVAGLLCYLGVWITGIIFFVIEQKDKWVRFHAAQSIVVFGTIIVAGIILGLIPVVGVAFSSIIWVIGFILWIILMVKAYQGERYKIAWAGDIAEKMVNPSGIAYEYQKPPAPPEPVTPPEPARPVSPTIIDLERQIGRKVEEFFKVKREGRITGSAFAIAWSIVLLIFFNFFNEYVAYYHAEAAGDVVTWTRTPFFTSEINLWLPILTTTLVISILGHIVLIIYDRYVLREFVHIVIGAFSLATVITLLTVFPFDFSVIPNAMAATGTHIGVIIVLICISVGIGIGLLVRAIKLIVNVVRGTASYQEIA
jgi:uncharacterized membrane protein